MTANAALLATRYARRPLLLEPGAAQAMLQHLSAGDPRGLLRESRFDAVLRRVGLGRMRPRAQDHVDDANEEAGADASGARRAMAYAPLWARQTYGEPEDEGFAWSMFQGIACMEINTAIGERGEYYCGSWYHGYDTILAGLRDATADERVKGVFIHENTPGGVVSGGLDDVTGFMREARAAAGGKPIHVHAEMACSAGYWIGTPADRLTASRYGLVGSVGACIIHEDYSGAYEKAGLVITPIQFGDGKTDFAHFKALSARAREDMQAEIDQIGRDFVNSVCLDRPNLTPEAVLATQARVFMAQNDDPARSALALGLVDAIETEQEAFAALLALVSTPQGTESAPISPATSEPRSPSAIQPQKEKSMATPAPKVAAQVAQTAKAAAMKAERAKLATRMAEIDAATGDDAGGDGDSAGTEAETPVEGEEGEEDDPPAPPLAAEPDTAGETQAIAASAEAAAHPALALSAISSGLTLKQFKAMAATAGQPGKRSPLADAMAGSRRLGPDATKSGGGGSTLAANARKRAGVAD